MALATALSIVAPTLAGAQIADTRFWVTDANVRTIAVGAGTVFVGGWFSYIGPATGAAVPIDAATGVLPPSFPKVIGYVYAVAPDGSGGWFIGGLFTSVGGVPRTNLAHVAADFTVSGWNPAPDNWVLAIAVNGGTVIAGGRFTHIAGVARNRLAALDAASGVALGAWNPSPNGTEVLALAVSGSIVYVGGDFTYLGALPRNRIAALSAANGTPTAWDPNASGSVNALAVSGGTVFAGGQFTVSRAHPRASSRSPTSIHSMPR